MQTADDIDQQLSPRAVDFSAIAHTHEMFQNYLFIFSVCWRYQYVISNMVDKIKISKQGSLKKRRVVDSVRTFLTEVAIVSNGSPRQVYLGASLA